MKRQSQTGKHGNPELARLGKEKLSETEGQLETFFPCATQRSAALGKVRVIFVCLFFLCPGSGCGIVIKRALAAWEVSGTTASSASAGLSWTVRPQWRDTLSPPWQYPAGRPSGDSTDVHCLF